MRYVMQKLMAEYPGVPADVTALFVQLARLDVSPEDDPSALLAQARKLLGRSVLLQSLQDTPAPPSLAMAS